MSTTGIKTLYMKAVYQYYNGVGILFIAATPIGNLEDITLRVLRVLKEVDVIACEDTRHTLQLLNHFEIKKPLLSCRSQNEEKAAEKICSILTTGEDVAFVSDAGTPGISDPGARLVSIVRGEGHPVVPLPGVSAFATLCSVGGLFGKTVTFDGFLSPKAGRRRRRVRELLERSENFVLYESPFRIVKLLTDISSEDPDREVVLGREMTKKFEEYITGTAKSVMEVLEMKKNLKGEFSLLVSGDKKS